MTKNQTPICFALLLASFALTGCADPLVGDWQSKDRDSCGKRSAFTMNDDLSGEGKYYGCEGGQSYKCELELVADPKVREGAYEVEVEVDCGEEKWVGEVNCELKKDSQELDCDGMSRFERAE